MSHYLTYRQLAEKLGVPLGTLYSRVARKQIPFIRMGARTVRFDPDAIERWLREQNAETSPT